MTKKPIWTLIRKIHLNDNYKPYSYTECHDGPGTKMYFTFNGTRYESWEELLKAFNDS